uniref:zinc finger CCCH domain-containing protein 10-like n=1 Tax=Pristiophorus japonicus TaxID=55135 RepID=UPI00398E831C
MADNNVVNNGKDEAGQSKEDVCRDYLRNVCYRGKTCKYLHPDINEVHDLGVKKNEFVFCHYFMNNVCTRAKCTFIHGTGEDEEYYKKTGELPLHLRSKVAETYGLSVSDLPADKGEIPVCRDYLKGDCQRGSKCRFRHFKRDNSEHDIRLSRDPPLSQPLRRSNRLDDDSGINCYEYDHRLKRRKLEGFEFEVYEYDLTTRRQVDSGYLEEENLMLRNRNEELKKQVSNLMGNNEVLLEQNAFLRNQIKAAMVNSLPTTTTTGRFSHCTSPGVKTRGLWE